MKWEHFLYYNKNGTGYTEVKSPRLKSILHKKDYRELLQLQPPGVKTTWCKRSRLMAVSYLDFTHDEYERSSIYNYTLLMDILDYINFQGSSKFDRFFIKPSDTAPAGLKSLEVTP